MSQSLPQPGGMTQECALIIRIMNGTSTYVTRTPCHTMSQSLPQPGGMTQECALIIRIMNGTSTHNKDNEWYILRNKDTMSQSLPQPGGMTQEYALIIRIMNGTSTYVTRTPCHKACPNLVECPKNVHS